MIKNIAICDGSCLKNPGPGGWAFAVVKDTVQFVYGCSTDSTNNIMELTALINVFKETDAKTIYTDSTYVCNGITKWIHNWKRFGWVNSEKKTVKNIELWKELDELSSKHNVDIKWIKGHASSVGVVDKSEAFLINVQNMVDHFARKAAVNQISGRDNMVVSCF
jgi:ribonuclease HI